MEQLISDIRDPNLDCSLDDIAAMIDSKDDKIHEETSKVIETDERVEEADHPSKIPASEEASMISTETPIDTVEAMGIGNEKVKDKNDDETQ